MIFFLEIILVLSAFGYAIIYLYFLRKIRDYSEVDSFFALNFIKVYRGYLYTRKIDGKSPGLLFYLHFVFIIITLVLGYHFEGQQLIEIGG